MCAVTLIALTVLVSNRIHSSLLDLLAMQWLTCVIKNQTGMLRIYKQYRLAHNYQMVGFCDYDHDQLHSITTGDLFLSQMSHMKAHHV
jgi:hypothetical protein